MATSSSSITNPTSAIQSVPATTTILGQVVPTTTNQAVTTPISVPITTPTPTGEPRPHWVMVVIVIMVAALVRAGLTSGCGRGYWDRNRGGHSLTCCGGHT